MDGLARQGRNLVSVTWPDVTHRILITNSAADGAGSRPPPFDGCVERRPSGLRSRTLTSAMPLIAAEKRTSPQSEKCQFRTHTSQQTTCAVVVPYSTTSLARASSIGATVRPRCFAVLRLITSLNRVGSRVGGSAGLVPLRKRPVWTPA